MEPLASRPSPLAHLPSNPWLAFRPDALGRLVDRPNRFVVRVDLAGTLVEAHCPNPGRMTELLFPGTEVVLEKARTDRKLAYTLVAVVRPGSGPSTVVPVAAARSNAAVGALVLPRLFPRARLVQPEYTLEGSRFDWYVEDQDGRHLIEVKCCSEVEYGTALFPDAPSLRAVKHLEELARWGSRGYRPHVVFAVVHGQPSSLGPNIHTDPLFSRTLVKRAPQLDLHAFVFRTTKDGETSLVDGQVPFDFSRVPSESQDWGLLVRIEPIDRHWSVSVEAHTDGWARAVAKAPARQSFALRVDPRRAAALSAELGDTHRHDPRTNPAFVDTIMRWRHQLA